MGLEMSSSWSQILGDTHNQLADIEGDSDDAESVLLPVDFGARFRRTDRQTENRLDSDSDESVVNDDEAVLPVVDVAEDKKDDAKTLEFRGIDFVIEQIESLPKSKFANGEVIYQKRGKRDENELLDLLETHTAKFCQPVPKTDPITYAKKSRHHRRATLGAHCPRLAG